MDDLNDKRKTIYKCILSFDIIVFVFFKYTEFIYNTIATLVAKIGFDPYNRITSSIVDFSQKNCPQKISYFMLILIAYITDVYWGKRKAIRNPGKVALVTSYFPLMTSGPIIRTDMMEGQLWGEKNTFSYDRCVRGMERVLWGLYKKMVLSERLAVVVTRVYDYHEVYYGLYVPAAAAMFAMQIYCDFSGLMDIVIGCSEVLGITLPENFRTPFYSTSIAEFWRRWHITLGAFLKDYVLFSLQRGRWYKKLRDICKKHLGSDYKKKYNFPAYFSLFIAWFLIGLWHGAGWNYVFGVGIYMWFVMVLSELLSPVFMKMTQVLHINTECASYTFLQRIRTFMIYIFGVSFFRAQSIKQGFEMWKGAFTHWNPWIFFDESFFKMGLDRREWGILIFGLLLLFVVSYISQKRDVRGFIKEQNFIVRLFLFAVLFIMITVYGYYGTQFNAADFIYGRF